MAWREDEPVRGGYPDMRLLGLSGLERMNAVAQGWMLPPPTYHLLGLRPTRSSPASVTFTMPASPWLQSSAGVFFAGTAALVADAPLGGVIIASLPAGQVVVTSDLTLNFLRPMSPASGHLSARARLIDVGRTLGLSEALVEDAQGNVVAHATSRCFVRALPYEPMEGEPERADPVAYDSPDPWERPLEGAGTIAPAVWASTPFDKILELVASGELPRAPVSELLALRRAEVGEGRFVQRVTASEWFCSPARTIYGGVLALLADIGLTGAVSSTLPPGTICSPLDLKVNFIRPGFADGRELIVDATVRHRGRSLVVADCEVRNGDGKTLVLASGSSVVIEGRDWGTFVAADDTPPGDS